MATTQREERTLLGHDSYKLIEPSHYPALGALSGEELRTLAARLREQHDRARDLIREGRAPGAARAMPAPPPTPRQGRRPAASRSMPRR